MSNDAIADSAVKVTQAEIAGSIVSQTLDKLNKGPGVRKKAASGMNQTYDLSQQVLGSVYSGKGAIADALS